MVININRIFMIKSTTKSTLKINNKSVNNKTFKKGKN